MTDVLYGLEFDSDNQLGIGMVWLGFGRVLRRFAL